MNLSEVRDQFPALKKKVFLDAACVSLAPLTAIDAVKRFLDSAAICAERSATKHHIAMDDAMGRARPEAARLINASENEIALVESTSHGLSVAASSIPLERGNRVLICNLEFMEVAIPWVQRRDELGLEIDVVPHHKGELRVEDIAERIGPKTRVVAVSSVQWTNGYRVDLAALSKLCRDHDIWLVVDAIQQLGAFPIDVKVTPVDILVCGGHKWLNSPFGEGFMYIRQGAITKLKPGLAGYLGVKPPADGWGSYFQDPSTTPVKEYDFIQTARRFETGGTANYPGAIGLAASLKMINDLGTRQIAEHIYRITDRLVGGLNTLGFEIVTPIAKEHRSGIITFSAGDPSQNVAMMERLLDRRIMVSVRYTSGVGGIRVSSHFYNSEEDIDALLNLL